MTKIPKRTLTLLFFTVFIDLVGFGMIIPLIPYLGESLSDSSFKAGLLMSIYSLMQFLFNPFWGQLSDKFGRRPILLISLIGASVSHLGFAFSTSFWMMFSARLFAGVFAANISAAMAAVADISDESERSKRMGLIGAAFGLGFTIGPFFGGIIGSQGALISTEAPFGVWTSALVASLICFLNFIFAYFYLPETNPNILKKVTGKIFNSDLSPKKSSQRKVNSIPEKFLLIFEYFKKSEIRALLITYGLNALSMALIEVSLFLFVKDRFGLGLKEASYGFAYTGSVLVFTQGYLIRKLLPKFGERILIQYGLFMFALGVFGVAITYNFWLLILPVTILSVAQGLLSPSITGSLSLKENADHQGRLMGVTQSLSALGRILGPLIAGLIYTQAHQVEPFYLSAILTLFSLTMFTHRKKETKNI